VGILKEIIEKFQARPADFTPEQLKYIARMFERKGPVLVRMGVKKETRFYSPGEWKKVRGRYFPEKGKKRGVR